METDKNLSLISVNGRTMVNSLFTKNIHTYGMYLWVIPVATTFSLIKGK